MPDPVFSMNTPEGQTIARELLISYLNTGTLAAPDWAIIGQYVEDSSEELDWSKETKTDIVGISRTTMKKPIIEQTFDPCPLAKGNKAVEKIHDLAIIKQDAQALAAQDMLIAHWYLSAEGAIVGSFAERYEACAIDVTALGGEGGGNITMPFGVTYGGARTVGTVTKDASGKVVFTPADVGE